MPEGQDADCGTQASSGVGVGAGVPEVGTSKAPQSCQSDGDTKAKGRIISEYIRRICDQSRELGMALRAGQTVRLPNSGRELSLQGLINEAVQSVKETPKVVQKTTYPNWDTKSTRSLRLMVSGRHLGFRTKAGDEPNEV